MNWTCEQIEAQLTEYLDGALPTEVQAGFDAHVATCAHCAALVQTVHGMVSAMHSMEMLPVPPALTTKILEQTSGLASADKSWRAYFGWTRFVFAPKFAYGVLTVFITLIVLSQALGMKMRRPTIADLSPVNIYRTVNRQAHLMYARSSKFVADFAWFTKFNRGSRPKMKINRRQQLRQTERRVARDTATRIPMLPITRTEPALTRFQ